MTKLTLKECRRFIDLGFEKATEMGVPLGIAIVGPEAHLIAVERMDGAGFLCCQTAWAKAYTACALRAVSPRFQDGLVIQQWFRERNPQMMQNLSVMTGGMIMASGGAAPIFRGPELIGAYAVSGATSPQDEVIAEYARGIVGWQKKPEPDDTPESVKQHINELYEKAGLGHRSI